jgi:Fe-S cluster assembly scaffold protein SufB
MQERWEENGVIFCDMDTALRDHEEIVKEHFMNKCVPPSDNKFAALHGAVWSGGSFLYVPEGTVVDMPVQAYFRMNSENMGQFEHTLIIAEDGAEVHYIEGCSAPKYAASSLHAGGVEVFVGENAHVQYSTIQNWSKNTYNLNTKRAIVSANGTMEWISGSMGSKATMLYPSTMLNGVGATDNHITIAFAGSGQNIDTGAKVYHNAPQTTSTVESKSISTDGGRTNYRGLIHVSPSAKNSKTNVECVPEGSQIYTKSGYKPIQNIEIGELVLTHTGEFEPVQKCIENKNTEELLEFVVAGSGTSIVTTGNHPLLSDARTQYPNRQENKEFNLRWRDAEDIGKGDYLAVPRPDLDTHFSSDIIHNKYGNNYSKTLSLEEIDTKKLFRLIGYYLAEGCIPETRDSVHFRFNSEGSEYIDEIKDIIDDLGINARSRYDTENCIEIYVNSTALVEFIEQFGSKNSTKKIPSDFMTEESLRHMIPTMYYGDGAFQTDRNQIHYTTTSESLAQSLKMSLAYFGIGYLENIRHQSGRKPEFIVDVSGQSAHSLVEEFSIKGVQLSETIEDSQCMEITDEYIIYPIREINSAPSENVVYNLDVAGTSSYVVNGYAVHNCDAIMMDNESASDTMPYMEILNNSTDVSHEATVGKIGDEEVFYLQSRGLTDDDAKQMIVNGFIEPLTEELPIEYAVELNRLIELELEGSLG